MTLSLIGAALTAAGASTALGATILLSQGLHGKHTLDHDLGGVQKFHTVAVPRIGGVAVYFALLALLFFRGNFDLEFISSNAELATMGLLLIAAIPAFVAGLVEDLTKKVTVRVRLYASIASALLASWLLGATIDQLDISGLDALLRWTPLAVALTALAVAGGVNSINIIDGFNGLAASTVAVILLAFCVLALSVNDGLVAYLALIGCGTAVGFLIINFPTGRMFLGDGGAYFLGFWVAEIAVLLLVRNPSINAWQVLSICAYPIIEVFFSIYRRRFVRQTSPGAPDGLHLHTLVYRRIVPRFFDADASRPWRRNAAVTCIVVPCIALAAGVSVFFGRSLIVAVLLVLAQVVAYILVYRRIVRGRWRLAITADPDVASQEMEITR
jgi:UDP-N-acetylmuramyl pentapeptide phosphotransferase/UDP-N-acetylglucosamine-1-phosphate transferase